MWPVYVWAPAGQPLGFFGWQGIIPAKASQMAGIMTDLMTEKLVDIKEIFSRVKPEKMAALMAPAAAKTMRKVVTATLKSEVPGVSMILPEAVKDELAGELAKDAGSFIATFMDTLKDNVLDVFDLKSMCMRLADADKRSINDMFLACGKQEFIFIRRSGLYFGFLFGVLQLIIFIFYDPWWLAVIGGFLVGIGTNFIALKMIFHPIEPIHIGGWSCQRKEPNTTTKTMQECKSSNSEGVFDVECNGHCDNEDGLENQTNGRTMVDDEFEDQYDWCCFGLQFTLHGLFLKRQYEVSKTYSNLAAKLFLTPENIWEEIVHGNKAAQFRKMLVSQTELFIERSLSSKCGPLILLLPHDRLSKIKSSIVEVMVEDFEEILPFGYEYTQEALAIEKTLFEALVDLPSRDFERVLHPIFEEDELKLILVGGVLGILAGLFQGLVLFNI